MRNLLIALTAAGGMVSGGALFGAVSAADFSAEGPPPVAEAPPPVAPPPAVGVVPRPAAVIVEPPCPVVWRCGYWGCGWRPGCGAFGAEVYVGPRWGYYRGYHGYRGYWGHGYRANWGHDGGRWAYRHH